MALAALCSTQAQAALVGSLEFLEPDGTAAANEAIEVWVRLTLDPASDDLTWDLNQNFPYGVDPTLIPDTGFGGEAFESYYGAYSFVAFSCNDTFLSTPGSCSGGPYTTSYPSGPGLWFDQDSGSLAAGASMDILLTVLVPDGGVAPDGTYTLFNIGFGMGVDGEDANGNYLDADIFSFSTDCGDESCAFTRTISAVPLPAAAWLFSSALFGLVVARRRS
ncbi:VPLPA-CTERM sorting domain-containing protein [Mangrovimicrobium sediminis]|uniref:VPLPA-CTERM sorting domain-containing protein n=1 Tax=Mangrovimicrobium sediminis TaxID=2562682 RepID=UPI001981327B|nr:VPLPA-CTERM sorting domain-containing protein [Haliea sp. SAOS-164]